MYITSGDLKKHKVFDISGNTFDNRVDLKSIGAVYNPKEKRWTLRLAGSSHGKAAAAMSFKLSKVGVVFTPLD